ncbi:hypothetical protein ACP4OV_001466 [Aristida adscensionis]
MAEAADNTRALPSARRASAGKWEVEYARYFATPRLGPSTPPPGLRHVSRGKHRHHGTWLPAASPAELCITRPASPLGVPVLTVSIGEVVFVARPWFACEVVIAVEIKRLVLFGEEHFVSILNFSWPQVTCVTQCPIRGSRVVFLSFCDKSKQIQKFAVRFPQLSDAELFLSCVKNTDIISSGSDYICEDSAASQYIASNGLHQSFEDPVSDHMAEATALSYHEEQDQPVPEPLIVSNIDNIYSGFPPSFCQMLTNCSTENEQDAGPLSLTQTQHAPREVHALDTSHDITVAFKETTAVKGNDAGEGNDGSNVTGDIMARIKTYMVDDSFHDMLFKLERVIDELGGDLSL